MMDFGSGGRVVTRQVLSGRGSSTQELEGLIQRPEPL